jgi:hypothetical protein
MDIKDLSNFLIDSNKKGYASGKEGGWVKEEDGSVSIIFQKGHWKSHDNFFGGEPYGGRTVVFYKNKPVWIMVYYGWIIKNINPDVIYEFLMKALMNMSEEFPLRGPKKYEDASYIYTNLWNGDLKQYFGEECIIQDSQSIYKAYYRGGLVNQQ